MVRVRYRFQFLLRHVSVQTTERYLGCKQRIRSAVNDRIGIEPLWKGCRQSIHNLKPQVQSFH